MMIEKSEIRTDKIVCRFQLGRREINRREQAARIQVVFLNVKLVFSTAKNPRERSKSRKKSPALMIFFWRKSAIKKLRKNSVERINQVRNLIFLFFIFSKKLSISKIRIS